MFQTSVLNLLRPFTEALGYISKINRLVEIIMQCFNRAFWPVFFLLTQALAGHGNTARVTCTEEFKPISAAEFVAGMNPGWNLVTYTDHFLTGSPSWTIDPSWLQRVSDVVDMATERGFYVVTNMHHDSSWVDVTKSDANLSMIYEKFQQSWQQIGEKLGCKSSLLAFEPINEPPANTAEDGAKINILNRVFLNGLARSGGFNTQRVVTLVGGSMDPSKTSQWFVKPRNIVNPWALQYHYYNPYDFTFNAWGKTIWGSEDDKKAVLTDLDIVRDNFTDVPLVIGEYDAFPQQCETAARHKWLDFVTRQAAARNTSVMVWDNGDAYLDRAASKWRDPVGIDIMIDAAKGISNTLAESTVDPLAPTQSSSAYIFHRVGEDVTDQTVDLQLNGNALVKIEAGTGEALQSADFSISGSSVVFKAGFLSKYLSPTAEPGSKANLTLTFSAGAPVQVEIVQWDTPELATTSSVAVAGADLKIPVTFKGLSRLATVKMVEIDGTYLFDEWTKWLGPLQQARGTYDSQWRWDKDSVILTANTVNAVIAAGKTTAFTFEFYPRVPANAVNYTLQAVASSRFM
ncbi:uncharacterized protein E0L32_012066 [Thyridium curvatum]|uniref:Cellulase n=1 Tax=Thyridium curvatum TaxID=1093900 RepID=A0A507BKJ2_9PEZI|nr:uncharacterized protein E0L32_012066 [Thyridium curvatum]TPX17621.1 hypothetical protein E0L32_012066 [Thyridium curvatum]